MSCLMNEETELNWRAGFQFRGMLNMLKQVSDMNGTKSMDQSNAVLGEVVVTPVAFKMDENGQEKSDARPA